MCCTSVLYYNASVILTAYYHSKYKLTKLLKSLLLKWCRTNFRNARLQVACNSLKSVSLNKLIISATNLLVTSQSYKVKKNNLIINKSQCKTKITTNISYLRSSMVVEEWWFGHEMQPQDLGNLQSLRQQWNPFYARIFLRQMWGRLPSSLSWVEIGPCNRTIIPITLENQHLNG